MTFTYLHKKVSFSCISKKNYQFNQPTVTVITNNRPYAVHSFLLTHFTLLNLLCPIAMYNMSVNRFSIVMLNLRKPY